MPLPSAKQFVGPDVSEQDFKSAQTQLINYLNLEVPTNEQIQKDLSNKVNLDYVEAQSLTFGTTAELKLAKPKIGQKAKTLDSGKVWEWKGSGAGWIDTGEGELDRANEFTENLVLPISQEQTSAEFHNNDHELSVIPVVTSEDKILVAINNKGQILNAESEPVQFEFYSDDSKPKSEFSQTDVNGYVIPGGSNATNLDTSKMQLNEKDLAAGEVYLHNRYLKSTNKYPHELYEASQNSGIFKSPASIYAFLDQLTSENQDYISKTDLGVDDWGNVISQYTMTCPKFIRETTNDWSSKAAAPPKILLMSGTHGGAEKEAVISTILLMSEVVGNWRQSDSLSSLRWKTDLVVVPLLNPSGYILGTRENKNKVDLNRDGVDLTQKETQIAASLPNLHPDCEFFIDHHNSYAFGEHMRPFWLGFLTEDLLPTYRELAHNASIYLKKEMDLYADGNQATARLSKNLSTTIAANWTKVSQKNGLLLETPRIGGDALSTKNRRIHNLNCLLMTIKAIRDHQINQ